MSYSFTPPTRRVRPYPWHPLWSRTHLECGVSVLKSGGSYTQVIDPDPVDLAAADLFYIGGRSYTVSTPERNDLVAAGYGAYITGAP